MWSALISHSDKAMCIYNLWLTLGFSLGFHIGKGGKLAISDNS